MDPILVTVALVLGVTIFLQVTTNWRSGLFFILGVGFLQDPFRKLVPGEPVAISATVAVIMLFVWGVGLSQFGGDWKKMSVRRHYPTVANAFSVFGGLVLFQAIVTIVNFGSIALAGIGLIAYLSPLPGIWVGWWFFRTERDYLQVLQFYVAFGIVVALGVYLAWLDTDWVILKQVGEALVIYSDEGIFEMHAGFMRVSEIAAWHMGAATCFAIVLATTKPNLARTIVLTLAIAVLVAAIILTGRRKALAMIGLFVGILAILLQFSRNRDARATIIALVGLAVGALSMLFYLTQDASDAAAQRPYSDRADTIFEDAWDRFYTLGLASAGWAFDKAGFFGFGTGVVSQGGQHFGVDAELAGAAEGGLGKILLELGVPGLIVLAWLISVVSGVVRKLVALASGASGKNSSIALALVAFLFVNIIMFVVASQVFGDPFVLILLGIVFGGVLASPRLLDRQRGSNINVLDSRGSAGRLPEAPFGGFRP